MINLLIHKLHTVLVAVWLMVFLLLYCFMDLWFYTVKINLWCYSRLLFLNHSFVLFIFILVSRHFWITASCIIEKNTLSFCFYRSLLSFIMCSSTSECYWVPWVPYPLLHTWTYLTPSVYYVLDVIAQKNHDLSLENFMQTVGYTYLYPKRNEKCAYFSVAVLPMTGWEELHRGRRFPRKEKPACCLIIWSPLSWLNISLFWSINLLGEFL